MAAVGDRSLDVLNRASNVSLQNGQQAVAWLVVTCDLHEFGVVQQFEYAVLPADTLAIGEDLERLVGVYERQAKCIGDVLLCEWRFHPLALR